MGFPARGWECATMGTVKIGHSQRVPNLHIFLVTYFYMEVMKKSTFVVYLCL